MSTNEETPTPNVRKIARIEDKATGQFHYEIEFWINSTETRRLMLLPSIVSDPGKFEDWLMDHGAILPADKDERRALLIAVAESDAPEQLVCESQGGWLKPGEEYVLPTGAISVNNTNIIGISKSHMDDDPSGRRSKSRSLISWRDTVAQIVRLSSLLMFAICVALAAGLLAIVGHPSFAFCVYGRTRLGKTVATLVGGSVIGIGRIDDLISWNITDARLEQRLAEFNDSLFPIDDLSTMKGRSKEKYLRIRNVTYRISQGWSTGRFSSFTKENEGGHTGWLSIVLTSSEKSIRDLAAEAKEERQLGEALRMIDMPALFDGLDHIFDRRDPSIPVAEFNKWKGATFSNIVADCEANHGTALETYIERIITADFDPKDMVRKAGAAFVLHVSDAADGDIAQDVAGKFGLIYAGGLLGIRLGILPWNEPELRDAIAKCYRNARGELSDEGVDLRQGIAILTSFLPTLLRYKKLSDQELAAINWKKIDGYWRRPKGEDRYVIKREAFNALFAAKPQADRVLKWLLENNRITTAGAKTADGSTARRPKGQIIWSDGERRRSYEIVFSRA